LFKSCTYAAINHIVAEAHRHTAEDGWIDYNIEADLLASDASKHVL
jgi:hypothetical protein